MDSRIRLPQGFSLYCREREYVIEKYISSGANSIVYQARYKDTLMQEQDHTVLIKELYPLDPAGGITRNDKMCLEISRESTEFFQYHKTSFLLGNQAHLSLSADGNGHIAQNLDSFESNNTLYTVLTARKGEVLSKMLAQEQQFPSLTDAAMFMNSLLNALIPFHSHQLLHLDISPDNIFLLAPEAEGQVPTEVLLLDFNSVYSLKEDMPDGCQYYLGKAEYRAPEAALHRKDEIGFWTDIYSVCAVFYEVLEGKKLPDDKEFLDTSCLISAYSRLLLHEKEKTAELVNHILDRGLQLLPQYRYQNVGEMQADIQELLGIMGGQIRFAEEKRSAEADKGKLESTGGKKKKGFFQRKGVWAAGLLLAAGIAGSVWAVHVTSPSDGQRLEDTELDLIQFPLKTDNSVVLSEKNVRNPLEDNILKIQIRAKTSVRITLKDFEHPRDLSEVFETYGIFSFYNGKEDKRGWQFDDLVYDFFYTNDNTLHMELPIQDTNDFDLEYVGIAFANYNYTEVPVLLDIKRCTLIDGKGESYEMTDLLGSHILFFDEEDWQWNLMTTQNQEYVKTFQDVYGGKLVMDVAAGFLDSILEVKWSSDNPEIATVDDKGRIVGIAVGTATLTASVTDKTTGEIKETQMLVQVTRMP